MADDVRPDELVFEIDGAEPDTIDAFAALDFVRAMLRLVVAVGEAQGTDVAFSGIRVLNKCTAFAVGTPDPAGARRAAARGLDLFHRGAPHGMQNIVEDARRALRNLPADYHTVLRQAEYRADIRTPPPQRGLLPTSIEVLRAVPQRTGGTKPVARFRSSTETFDFTLSVSPDMARRLGGLLYTEVEIEAEVVRAHDGAIEGGHVLAVSEVGTDMSRDAWAAWYEDLGSPFDAVEDVEEALGRG